MLFKSNLENADGCHLADLFCQARLIELTSIVENAGGNASNTPAMSAEEKLRETNHTNRPKQHGRSMSVFHMTAHPSGSWEIRDDDGSKAGLFRTRQAAIKFARDESPGGQFVIIDDTTRA